MTKKEPSAPRSIEDYINRWETLFPSVQIARLQAREKKLQAALGQPRLPGPGILAALFVAAALVAVVSIEGPIPARYDVLKDFQPLIAAGVALAAAAIAYAGALAKVRLDRTLHDEEQARLRHNLLLKLNYAALLTLPALDQMRRRVAPESIGFAGWKITPADFLLVLPPEFEAAWDQIDLLDRDAQMDLALIRLNQSIIQTQRASLDQTIVWHVDKDWPPQEIRPMCQAVFDLFESVRKLVPHLPDS